MTSLNQDWDIAVPIDHTLVSVLPANIRGVIEATKTVLANEHTAPGASNSGVAHVAGSAMAYISTASTTTPGGDTLPSGTGAATSSNGRIAFSSYASNLYEPRVYVASTSIASSWVSITVAQAAIARSVIGTVTATSGINLYTSSVAYSIRGLKNNTYITGLPLTTPYTSAQVDIIKVGRNEDDTLDVVTLPDRTRLATTAAVTDASCLITKQHLTSAITDSLGAAYAGLTSGQSSMTLPNGVTVKWGQITTGIPNYSVEATLTFSDAFGTACECATLIGNVYGIGAEANNVITSTAAANFKYKIGAGNTQTKLYWIAIGY